MSRKARLMAATTERHFAWFKQCVEKWMAKLHIAGWSVYFKHSDLEDSFAQVTLNSGGRVVTFRFCKEWRSADIRPLNREEIDATALHEVIHAMLAKIRMLAVARFTSEEEIDNEIEELTVRLENIIRKRR